MTPSLQKEKNTRVAPPSHAWCCASTFGKKPCRSRLCTSTVGAAKRLRLARRRPGKKQHHLEISASSCSSVPVPPTGSAERIVHGWLTLRPTLSIASSLMQRHPCPGPPKTQIVCDFRWHMNLPSAPLQTFPVLAKTTLAAADPCFFLACSSEYGPSRSLQALASHGTVTLPRWASKSDFRRPDPRSFRNLALRPS